MSKQNEQNEQSEQKIQAEQAPRAAQEPSAPSDGGQTAAGAKNKNAAAIRSYITDGEDPKGKRKAERAARKAARRKGESGSGLAGRQWKIIAIAAAVVVALIPLYFAVIRPLVSSETPSTSQKPTLTPEKGEVQTESGYLGMMPTLGLDDVQDLTLTNDNGSWGFHYYEEQKMFFIKDHRQAIYDETTWTTIFYTFGTASFTARAAEGEDIRYADYGLAAEDDPTYCDIITKDGSRHRVVVGNSTASGGGYYACYEHDGERRDTVYIVNSLMGECVNLSMNDVLNPIVTLPLDEKEYVPERFDIYHQGAAFLKIRLLSESEITQTETAKTNHVYLPNGIEYNSSSEYMAMLYSTLRGGISGKRVVKHAPDDGTITAEDLAEYGIHVPASYDDTSDVSGSLDSGDTEEIDPATMPYMILSFTKGQLSQELLFSEKTEEGTYFVYVALLDMIVEVDASSVSFMEWEEKKFIDASVFLASVFSIKDMTVDSTMLDDRYVASGVPRVKETFRLTSKVTTAADGTDMDVLTNVTVDSLDGGPVPDPIDSKDDGITNFKQYYMVLITIGVQLDVPKEVLEKIDLDAPDAVITMHTVRDQEHILRFYFYNSRHAYYTLDGKGQFYVVYDELTKFLSDTVSVVQGRAVDWETNNNNQVQVDTNTGDTTLTDPVENEDGKDKNEEKAMPSYFIVIVVLLIAVAVFGVGGFAVYAAVRRKKMKEEREDS